MEYEVVIGLEVHVQLKTNSKMFTRVAYEYGHEPNSLTDPVVLALPGALPVMNKEAIRKSIQVGLMLGCKIPDVCKWDRKNYFYPDSPKNYQITQFDQPICEGGGVEIEMPGPSRNVMGEHRVVELTRIHLEEDVGKLTHGSNDSLVDYNRAGTPLIEIVSEPDLYSPDEAFAYLTSLRNSLIYAGLSDCDMEKGQMRCDANISIRPKGEKELGVKVELKNLNSITGVKNGLEYEIKRQHLCKKTGTEIVQETRRWDPIKNETQSMRSKEMAHDYRYFPDPDLMPVVIDDATREELGKDLPELPFVKQRRFFEQYDLPYTVTSVLCPEKPLSDYFEASVAVHSNPKAIANLIVNELLGALSAVDGEGSLPLNESKVKPEHIASLVKLVDEGKLTKQVATKEVFPKMFATGEAPEVIFERDKETLAPASDDSELEKLCQDAIAGNAKAVQQFKDGNEKAINALKGPIMKATKGKANPQVVDAMLKKLIG